MTQVGLIPDEWLVSYAAGALSDERALLVATHVAYHPGLKAKVADAEAVGGALLDTQDVAATEVHTSFDDLMARIDMDEPDETDEKAPALTSDDDLPDMLRSYLDKPLDDLKWRMMGPGMYQHKLSNGPDGEKLWLLRARGGTEMPVHDHRGLEMTLVLRGSYRVGDKRYGPGLLELADSDVVDHQPMIDEGEDCICLVVTDAPIRLHSLIGRMVQPFIGL